MNTLQGKNHHLLYTFDYLTKKTCPQMTQMTAEKILKKKPWSSDQILSA